jgi:hypothetical protein
MHAKWIGVIANLQSDFKDARIIRRWTVWLPLWDRKQGTSAGQKPMWWMRHPPARVEARPGVGWTRNLRSREEVVHANTFSVRSINFPVRIDWNWLNESRSNLVVSQVGISWCGIQRPSTNWVPE